jgi:hypothetical protein
MRYIQLAEDKGYAVRAEINDKNMFTAMRIKPRENGMEVYRTFLYRICKCGKEEVVQVQSRNYKVPKTCRKCNAYNTGRKNFIENASDKTIYRREHR